MKKFVHILLLVLLSSCVRGQIGSGILGPATYNQPSTLRARLQPLQGALKLSPSGSVTGYFEASTVKRSDGKIRIYTTHSYTYDNHQVGMLEVDNIEDAWGTPTPLIGKGLGGAPAGRNASASCVVETGGVTYALALNGYGFPGEDRCIYGYKSADGVTFTDLGKLFDTSTAAGILGYGNASIATTPTGEVANVGGYYYAAIDIWTGTNWAETIWRSTSLESGWAMVGTASSLSELVPTPGDTFGGGHLIYDSGTWHLFYHYTPEDNHPMIPSYYTAYQSVHLPSFGAWATSTDLSTWTIKERPFLTLETNPFTLTDQVADFYVMQVGGTTYIVGEYVDNDAAGGYDNIVSQLRLWTYPGTFAQMISGL
jgi:hypothetical protein